MRLHGSSAEYCEKAERVLEAARAWRKESDRRSRAWLTSALKAGVQSGTSLEPDAQELADAIDALDAPVERYTVDNVVFRGCGSGEVEQTVRDVLTGTHFTVRALHGAAEKIAAALNAAERKP